MKKQKQTERKLAEKIVKKLRKGGYEAYFAGGCVRDIVMRRDPKDFDIATTANPNEIESLFEQTIDIGKKFGVITVRLEGINFEVATFRKERDYVDGRRPSHVTFCSPEEDAKRRDFTVNGLFYDPAKKRIIDFVGGKKDIKKKIIRTIGNPKKRFDEDKLRIIRAIRFATSLNFKIERKTWNEIKKHSKQIKRVSVERIRDELIRIFTQPNADRGLDLLYKSGILKVILPEIAKMKGVGQPRRFHPEGDVYNHTKLMLKKLRKPSVVLAFSALLHDVGKPRTYTKTDRIHFYEHSRVGTEITKRILERLRFPKKIIQDILACIENHMRFIFVKQMREGKLKKFMTRPTFQDELELHKIDCAASHGKLDNYYFLKRKLKKYKEEELKPKKLIDGYDLIEMGMKTGPLMGKILDEIYEMQLEGKIKSKEEALRKAKEKMKAYGS